LSQAAIARRPERRH